MVGIFSVRVSFPYPHLRSVVCLAMVLWFSVSWLHADQLVLGEEGKSDYQVVLPDRSPDMTISAALRQTARLVQTVFRANGIELPVAAEQDRDRNKPGIFLGNTAFARSAGVDTSRLKGWNYVLKVVGQDVIIAGKDEPPPAMGEDIGFNAFYRLGTLKAALDFLREYAGTYFLYPGSYANRLPSLLSSSVSEWQLAGTAAIEYKPVSRIEVPSGLHLHRKFFIGFQKRTSKYALLYDVANNFFPPVSDAALHHTYHLAVSPEVYGKAHPEYFLFNGEKRMVPDNGDSKAQYCISNPGFQDALYRWYDDMLGKGFESIHILQPDGFRPCQCEECRTLYGVEDWGEKLWIFHRTIAERLQKTHPGKKLVIHSYGPASTPPKTFDSFPANVSIYTSGTVRDCFARFSHMDIPGGFYTGIHNWIPHMASRYTPTRTPLFVEEQVRYFYSKNVQAVSWDGVCYLYGLEGPVVYLYGRMFEDPETLQAKDLMHEFCGTAFGRAASDMLRFYDRLYHAIEPYSQYLGTERPAWVYTDIYGRGRKVVTDPFRMLGFLYTPALIDELERHLEKAEGKAVNEKVSARLALVRREFDYLKALATVVQLHQAYAMRPDRLLRDRLLDAIDERNALIRSWYDYIAARDKGRSRYDRPGLMPGWGMTLFPPSTGHNVSALQLNFDSYGNPFKDTPLNWDTDAVRKAPLPGTKQMKVALVEGPVGIGSTLWTQAESGCLGTSGEKGKGAGSVVKVLCDSNHLYIRMENKLTPGNDRLPGVGRDGNLAGRDSVAVYLAPVSGQEIYYRFEAGVNPDDCLDAVNRLLSNPLDPAYAKDDPSWNGKWSREIECASEKDCWVALLTIPFASLGVQSPEPGETWLANFGAVNRGKDGSVTRSFWSVSESLDDVGHKRSLGCLQFVASSDSPGVHPSAKWRRAYYEQTFRIPDQWQNIANPLPETLDSWLFRSDELEQGVKDRWYAVDMDESDWRQIPVPSFWRETGTHFQGYGWYRIHFDVPAEWRGRMLRLMFAGVDEQAWIYVNGEAVREHTVESEKLTVNTLWETPFTVDVPAALLNYGSPNVLVVRVRNDKGSGGIWRPVLAGAVDAE